VSDVEMAFERTVDEGRERLKRSWSVMMATGAVGGIDVGLGVLALLLTQHLTHSTALAALAFSAGFVALTLANSELFTEDFLVPIAAVAAHKARARQVVRLWGVTLVANFVGGWVIMGVVVAGLPDVRAHAVELGHHFAQIGYSGSSFATAVLGGAIITLMTWLERSTESVPAKLLAAVVAGYLLAAGSLNHSVVLSLEMFAALHAGAPFGYVTWLGAMGWATLGNIIGGVGLVTVLRLVQVGSGKISDERDRPHEESREQTAEAHSGDSKSEPSGDSESSDPPGDSESKSSDESGDSESRSGVAQATKDPS